MVPSKPIKPPTPGGKKTHIDKVPAQGVSAGIIAIAIIIPLVVIIIIIIIVWYYKRQQKLKLEHN